jgi:hypothetical protein
VLLKARVSLILIKVEPPRRGRSAYLKEAQRARDELEKADQCGAKLIAKCMKHVGISYADIGAAKGVIVANRRGTPRRPP